jgi:hypothetical protein
VAGKGNSPILKMISKVKVKAIVEAAIAQQSFQGQERMIGDLLLVLLDVIMEEVLCGKSSRRLVIFAMFIIQAIQTVYIQVSATVHGT